ncbi:hypothetical protein [Rhodococcus sp. NPDC127528]|uniref:hypothetical protein n=1 Tax=unclassified Rhodococcus (in: high G+C Gram-positive bacteria) TaxID=192944 RepID=UPI00363C3BF3
MWGLSIALLRRRTTVLAVAATVSGVLGAMPAAAAERAQPPTDLGCAWQFMSNSTVLNVAFPDANATYWVLPYSLGAGDRIELAGQYPHARYMSLNTYGTNFDTVDTLRDNQITPDPGSTNPFAGANTAPGAPRSWHATVLPGTADHAANQIRGLPAAGQSAPLGFLIIRVYVPDDPNSAAGGVPLPDVTLVHGDGAVRAPVATCTAPFDPAAAPNGPVNQALTAAFDSVIAGAASGAFPGNVPEATFVNPASTSGLFPNGDNKYLGAGLTYQPGRIVVVRGRAPTFPDTRAGASPTEPGEQVRYWSMCQNDQVSPYPVVACAADFQTRVDSAGNYTYVVAAPADVPVTATTDPTVTVLLWGSTQVPKKVLFMRHMLPSAQFYPQSVQASQDQHIDPATSMGAYYPEATYCSTSTFDSGGYRACFDTGGG